MDEEDEEDERAARKPGVFAEWVIGGGPRVKVISSAHTLPVRRSSPVGAGAVRGSYSDFRIAAIVGRIRQIPEGSVQTYGGIYPPAPRLVGRVLATTDLDLPWHRVGRADGSIPKGRHQRELLLREGVAMRGDRVDLKRARR